MTEHILHEPEPFTSMEPAKRAVWGFFGPETVSSQVIQHLTFADIVRENHVSQGDLGKKLYGEWDVNVAVDEDGRFEFEDAQEQALFEQVDVGTGEFSYYVDSLNAVDDITAHMPAGGLANGFNIATKAKLGKLLSEQRRARLDPLSSPELIRKLYYAQRDLTMALLAISTALALGSRDYDEYTHAWHEGGNKSRNGGYNATYSVCNVEPWPDYDDHAEHFFNGVTDDGLLPDEFHNPGKLEIRVDPAVRIEFIYTPEIESARSRHGSHSTVTQNGVEKNYENQTLSIRIDLDPNAPHGVALDTGRSAYDGGKDGRHIKRDSDLLGSVFGDIEDQGSHEYSGFDETSLAEFPNFAERLAIQLDLQNKEIKRASIGRVALQEAA